MRIGHKLFWLTTLFTLMLVMGVYADTCVARVQDMPASCTDGTLTQDTFDGCRHLTCASGSSSMSVLACDKPDSQAPQYFEMYKQSQAGNALHICLGTTCMSETNYLKSGAYPFCSAPPSPPTNQTCYASVQNVPATCTGTITSDSWNGCRNIVCASGANSISIQACDKTINSPTPQYFEMYRQSATGTPPRLCIDGTCLQNDGYAKSASFPICTASNTPPPSTCTPSTEVCDGKDNNCDGQVDENNVCSQPPACFTHVQEMPVTCAGTLMQDSYDGCRHLTCANGANSIQVLACDKPTAGNAEYFEMYRQAVTGTAPRVCVATFCMQNEGFLQSGHYPLCMASNTTCKYNGQTYNPGDTFPAGDTCNTCSCTSSGAVVCTQQACTQNMCYSKIGDLPASCTGTITQDSTSGTCRTLVCTASGSSMQVLACDKTGYFEMYKQSSIGPQLQLCLAGTCIRDNGYAKSSNYPICTGTSGNTTTPTGIVWIEPVESQQNTPPNFFHLNVQVPTTDAQIPSTEWEIWDSGLTERVWYANNAGAIRFHTHTPDGTFQGSLAGKSELLAGTTYKVRTRWLFTNGSVSDWSSWRTFGTSVPLNGTSILWTAAPGFQVERVATGFDVPVHIAFAPRGKYDSLPASQAPLYYVTELYGKVKVVHRDGSVSTYAQDLLNFNPFGSITGGGQMGVVGIYVDQGGDLFVGMTYVDNNVTKNKVVRFTSTADGNTYTGSRTLISNLPSSPSHQVEEITKGPDGKIYVQLGDGLNEQQAQDDTILAGKIIRMNPDGTSVEVYAKGLRNPFGGDWRPGTNQLFVTDNSPNTNDRLLRITQGGNYLWGTGGNAYVGMAIDLLNVSPVDLRFNRGNSGFPTETTGRMYVAVAGPVYTKGPTRGKEVWEYTLDTAGNIIGKRWFLHYTGTGYGTPIGLDFGPDGLYFTDIYGEPGFVGAGKTEGNIYRITPGNGGCINCGGTGSFRAGIQVASWYPKDNGHGIEYIFECNGIDGSGSYLYDFNYGNGGSLTGYSGNRVGPITYPYGSRNYTVSCTAHDKVTGKAASASMTINPADFISDMGSY